MRVALVALALVLSLAAPASAKDPVTRSEFRAVQVGDYMAAVRGTVGPGRLTLAWVGSDGVARHRRIYSTSEGRGTYVRLTSRETPAGHWRLAQKLWCVTADFGPTFTCKPRPYPW